MGTKSGPKPRYGERVMVSARIPTTLAERMKARAKASGCSVSELMMAAVARELDWQDYPGEPAYEQEVLPISA